MATQPDPAPKHYLGVTVSSTFTDLQGHRAALVKAISEHGMHPVAMEHDPAKAMDVIDSSLQMVRHGSAYVGIISKKYGQTPECATRNPDSLSITELEFNEAMRLGRPILLFIMGEHLVLEGDIERNAKKKKKLKAFTERAKKMNADSAVHRIYATFNSLEDFKDKIGPALAELRRYLDTDSARSEVTPEEKHLKGEHIPKPPSFYAEPDYIGSHNFIGRQSQLQELSDWALPADPHTVLLFEAIGGNGKSMLTWEWTNRHSTKVRSDWAGRFWYSFYERGAIMADFCQRALAYMTGQPLQELRRKKTAELTKELLLQLHDRPWLLILDGLERVLVAYHRIDAAEVPDEEINRPTDKIVNRDPCSAIRDEDDDVLRSLAAAAPSKILISSRLTPRVLLNTANQPIPGVRRISLPGLRPPDAEALLRSCGIKGSSEPIQKYLTANCDCHPLVIGVLAGLINDYLPDKGNFDAWAADPDGGGQLNLASLDLIQRRNHILRAALAALPEKSRQLLSTLAFLPESVDYPTLCALNPHLPPEPEEVEEPTNPEEHPWWNEMLDAEKAKARNQYEAALVRRKEYEQAIKARLESAEFRAAPGELAKTVRDLERRGLLQYDGRTKRYDLHPVVRGVAAGGLRTEERERYGRRVVDHFSQQTHNPYEEAETLEDVRIGLNLVRTLIKIGHFEQAADAYQGELSHALLFILEAYSEALSLLRPFFSTGWGELPSSISISNSTSLTNGAAIALDYSGELREGFAAYSAALRVDLETENWSELHARLNNVSQNLSDQNLLAKAGRVGSFDLDLATLLDDKEHLFLSRILLFDHLLTVGRWEEAEATWQLLDPMGRTWSWSYCSGNAELVYAVFQFWKGELREEHLALAERLANEGKNRLDIRRLYYLRGMWRLEQGEWALATASLQETVRMARERGNHDVAAETGLALAKFYLGQLTDPCYEAEQLAQARKPAHRLLADLWLAIGNHEQAQKHALAAYQWAWADGEPYVNRYELTKTTALLQQLGVPLPKLPPYDPAKDEKLPWEDAVAAAIEKLRAKKEAEKRKVD
jgi:hypothetical protein